MPRKNLFVALPLPSTAQKNLQDLNILFPRRRFGGNLHLTLYFIGSETPQETYIKALDKVRAKAFTLSLGRLGTFGNSILWAGLEPCAALFELQRNIAVKMAETGHKGEERMYRPHITLCRLKSPLDPMERKAFLNAKCEGRWTADSFCLFESALLPAGAVHKVIKSFPLENQE